LQFRREALHAWFYTLRLTSPKDARGDQCDTCGRTLDAVELINPRCILDKTHKVVTRISSHMYVRLDKIQPQTEEWIKESWRKGKWSPNSIINSEGTLIDARLKGGLHSSPVTRDLKWGVPVPVEDDDPNQDMKGKVLCELLSLIYLHGLTTSS
jgi:methionyl-tRNA synthetase